MLNYFSISRKPEIEEFFNPNLAQKRYLSRFKLQRESLSKKLVFLFLVWSASTATDPAPDGIGVVVDRTLLSAFVVDVSIRPCDGIILGLFSPLTNCIWGFAGLGGGCAMFERNLTDG